MTSTDRPAAGGVQNPGATTVFLPECPTGRWWVCALLGVVFIAGGMFMLWNLVAATFAAAIFFAAALVVSGGFQIGHALASPGWRSRLWSVAIGALFVLGGVLLLTDPLATSLGLTLAIAALFLVTGVLRIILAFRHWRDFGWLLLISGLFGIALGVALILWFPWTGLFVPGMLLGIDFIIHGVWWLVLGFFVRRPRDDMMRAQPAAMPG